jgi:hypothetical protein
MVVIPSIDTHTALDIGRLLLEAGADHKEQSVAPDRSRYVAHDSRLDDRQTNRSHARLRATLSCYSECDGQLLEHGALVDLPSYYGVNRSVGSAGVVFCERLYVCRIRY